ncbi:MAG: WYL domain-containing protein [Longimonas sp.]|uniref:helix-turn-helix transcriptional regulator n=1 Tax=Longimonas sp. TaxID=2039626 RepID=UPI0039750E08
MESTDRWPAILALLSADRWVRAEDMAAQLGISPRTVYREMQRLMDADAPVEAVPGYGYRLDAERMRPVRTLTDDERVALTVGAAWGAAQLSGRWQAAAHGVQGDLRASLPEAMQRRAASLTETHVRGPAQSTPPRDTVAHRLQKAIGAEQTVRVEHAEDTDKKAKPVLLNPYALVRAGTVWQVVGYVHRTERVQHIALSTITDLHTTDDTFERPPGYRSTARPAASPERTVRVRFATEVAEAVAVPAVATVVEREATLQGLRMTLRVAHERDLVPWLLSWGAKVYVEAPTALRNQLVEVAQRIAEQYPTAPTLLS